MRGAGLLPLVLATAWLGAVVLVEWLRPVECTASPCLFRAVTGLPCPTCGSTRAVRALLKGQPIEALRHNPLATAAIAGGALWLLMWAAGAAPPSSRWLRPKLALAAAALLAANWCYLLAHEGRAAAEAVSVLPWH